MDPHIEYTDSLPRQMSAEAIANMKLDRKLLKRQLPLFHVLCRAVGRVFRRQKIHKTSNNKRLRELNAEIECLKQEKDELEKMNGERQPITITESELNAYVEELRETLTAGTISERKGFIRSFIKKIVVGYPDIEVHYTVPLPVGCAKLADYEVLRLVQNGDPGGIRPDGPCRPPLRAAFTHGPLSRGKSLTA